jgi:hypothetical protein
MVGYFAEKEPLFVKNPRKGFRVKVKDPNRINRVLHHDNASSSPFDLGHRKHTAKAWNTIGLRLINDRLVIFVKMVGYFEQKEPFFVKI